MHAVRRKKRRQRNLVPEFQYQRALTGREIRLLSIDSGQSDDKISVKVSYGNLDDSGLHFRALSYVWGQQHGEKPILCNDCRARVTKNLYDALLQLRGSGFEGLIWIDALCINQSDVKEKTEQVRLMRTIYGIADSVIIWLGKELPGDRNGYELIKRLNQDDIKHSVERSADGVQFLPKNYETMFGLPSISEAFSSSWRDLACILNREWFSRIWVVQELVASQHAVFRCGDLEMDTTVVLDVAVFMATCETIRYYASIRRGRQPVTVPVLAQLKKLVTGGLDIGIINLLHQCQAFKATDPRDKIFALVGLATDVSMDFIDYEKPLEHVLTMITISCLTKREVRLPRSLGYLSFIRGKTCLQIPSWVVDWSYSTCASTPLFEMIEGYRCNAWYESFSIDLHQFPAMIIRGKIVDRVTKIIPSSPHFPPVLDERRMFSHNQGPDMLQWNEQVKQLVKKTKNYINGEDLVEIQALTMAFFVPSKSDISRETLLAGFIAWQKMISIVCPLRRKDRSEGDAHDLDQCLSYIQDSQALCDRFTARTNGGVGRLVCLSAQGHLGWVRLWAQVGDQIACFWGTNVLFVLRPVEGGYKLLGDCYLYGQMEGEPMAPDSGELTDIRIV